MNIHLKILGWIYLVIGALTFVSMCLFIYALYATSGPFTFSPDVRGILLSGYGKSVILVLMGVASVGTFLTGWALLKAHKYARTLALIFAILGILDFPFGTMLGVYTLWVLSQTREGKMLAKSASQTPGER